MTLTIRPALRALITALAVSVALPALADGPVLLTVTGAIQNPNRGEMDPERDKLMALNDVSFERAYAFDVSALAELPQQSITTDFPKDGPQVTFAGPLLGDVLDAAGAMGDMVTVRAMDGYAVEARRAELVDMGAMVATSRDGVPLGIGDFGPTQIVFPRGEREELADMNDDLWIWQIYHIAVE